MQLKKIDDDYAVSGQITVDDLTAIKSSGYKSVICNRPDGEVEQQPTQKEITQTAEALGLKFECLPITSANDISAEHIAEFKQAFAGLPKPVLAYCRSGTRSTILWSLAQAGKSSAREILEKTAAAGYDMSPHYTRLQNLHNNN